MAQPKTGEQYFVKLEVAQQRETEVWHRGLIVKVEGSKATLVVPIALGEAPRWAQEMDTFKVEDFVLLAVCRPAHSLATHTQAFMCSTSIVGHLLRQVCRHTCDSTSCVFLSRRSHAQKHMQLYKLRFLCLAGRMMHATLQASVFFVAQAVKSLAA